MNKIRLPYLAWIALLVITFGLLWGECYSVTPIALGAMLLPVGLVIAGVALYHFPVAHRPTVIAGTVLLILAMHGFLLVVLGIQGYDMFTNRQSVFITLLVILGFVTAGFLLCGLWLVRRATLLASWPLLLCWISLICIEVGALNLNALLRPMFSDGGSHQT